MSSNDNELFKYTAISASALINDSLTRLGGLFVSSASGATITIYDNAAASGAIAIASFTPVAGVNYAFPALLKNGCYVSVTGTLSATVFWV
ncbi:hypothetical protein LZG74_25475 [Dyadobacter sp. CY327]|uniref:hypothetical protein n=1 Tax=Dyadobacter sp. CY327 TaxID=2907301 RepID=UPI001F31513A|nr:hypothetical protein [Dyadobacter sp. CY327]MCE7073686.1 hypothetical protein [Dyadobacter sp. CY327]